MMPPLEDVLNDFAVALEDAGGGYALLQDWTARYPEYAEQLADLAADAALERYIPPAPAEVDQERLLQVALDAAQGVLERARAERPAVAAVRAELPGLVARAGEVGLNICQLADRTQLSVTLVGLLDRRLVRFASIPREVVDALASALQTRAASVTQYLQQSPSFAPSASFRAESAPTLPPQQDFAEAVRQDPTLDENRRATLLRLGPPNAG
jgi:hypothetical protein